MKQSDIDKVDWASFQSVTFEDFKKRALDPNLNSYEKIGFPTFYREGRDRFIFEDILSKLENLKKTDQVVLDIGAGCGVLSTILIEHCGALNHELMLMDSEEMLSQLVSSPKFKKYPGRFPEDFNGFLKENEKKVDVILCYGVILCVFVEGNIFKFLDEAVNLLRPGGEFLIGDIPNFSKRNRFFSSESGVTFHKEFMNTEEPPKVDPLAVPSGKIDDAVLFSILQRYRNCGFDAYLVPQGPKLPMANRREDILIRRP
jgi:2-polyprenyl-3-methyl-5-hydroxy-6-metoxy-1,4-benzoquinol methylase